MSVGIGHFSKKKNERSERPEKQKQNKFFFFEGGRETMPFPPSGYLGQVSQKKKQKPLSPIHKCSI